jgi:uncharacterized protein with HEPN domain
VKGDRLYLTHILDAVEKIETYISVGHDVFVSTSHWQDAVIRQLEIIGEATKRLSEMVSMVRSCNTTVDLSRKDLGA